MPAKLEHTEAADEQHSSRANAAELQFMHKLFDQQLKSAKNVAAELGSKFGQTTSTAIGYTPTMQAKVCNKQQKQGDGGPQIAGSSKTMYGLEFVLNALKPDEKLIRAELHLLFPATHFQSAHFPSGMPLLMKRWHWIRRSPAEHKHLYPPPRIHILFGTCNGTEQMVLEEVGQSGVKTLPGWGTYNALPLVAKALRMENGGKLFMQLTEHFVHRNGMSTGELNQLVHLHGPFLVVYTTLNIGAAGKRRREMMPIGEHEQMKRPKRDVRATLSSYGSDDEIRQHMETARKTAEYYAYGMARPNAWEQGMPIPTKTTGKNDKSGQRRWRHPGDGPTAFLKRRKLKHQQRRRKIARSYPRFDPNDPMLGFGTAHSPWERTRPAMERHNQLLGNSLNDIRALQTKNSYDRVEQQQKGGAAVDKQNQQQQQEADTSVLLLDGEEEEAQTEEEKRPPGIKGMQKPMTAKCARHNFTLDFDELGWGKRIIAPKQFEASFCAGSCNPLDQNVHHTNHAILQSLIVHQRRRAAAAHHQQNGDFVKNMPPDDDGPPPVCCAPTKFDSLTLLYFDERGNVVLKNYPRMSVLECGCI